MAIRNSRITAVAIGVAVLVGASSFGAVAAKLVTSDDIKNQTIKKVDIGKDAVGGSEIEDETLKVKDFTSDALESLEGAKGDTGAKGEKGAPGVDGTNGTNGTDGVSGYEVDGFYRTAVVSDEVQVFTAECAAGKYAISGGFSPEDGFSFVGLDVIGSRPSVAPGQYEEIPGDPEGSVRSRAWETWVVNTGTEPVNLRPWVVCASLAN